MSERYTMIDLLVLGLIAAIYAVIFFATWILYDVVGAVAGPIAARLVSYGLWFMPAPLAASLIRKRLSALLGEFLPALLESIIPTPGALTNAIYGIGQGLMSEIAYAVFRYKRFDLLTATLAGALPGLAAVSLDAILFGDIYPWDYMVLITVAAMVSGAIYGALAYYVASAVRR